MVINNSRWSHSTVSLVHLSWDIFLLRSPPSSQMAAPRWTNLSNWSLTASVYVLLSTVPRVFARAFKPHPHRIPHSSVIKQADVVLKTNQFSDNIESTVLRDRYARPQRHLMTYSAWKTNQFSAKTTCEFNLRQHNWNKKKTGAFLCQYWIWVSCVLF